MRAGARPIRHIMCMARHLHVLALAQGASAFRVGVQTGEGVREARYSAGPPLRWALAPDFYELLLPLLRVETACGSGYHVHLLNDRG